MSDTKLTMAIKIAAAVAILFGLLTILSGGRALFGGAAAQAAAGDAVAFVLWFNFAAGFAYVAAGFGLFLRAKWAVGTAAVIAITTLLVFAAFGVHILADGAFETRTVGAMVLRSLVWIAIAVVGYRASHANSVSLPV